MSRGFGFRAFGMGYVVQWFGWPWVWERTRTEDARGWHCGPLTLWVFP